MIRIATRGSALAKAQASYVADLLGGAELVEVASDGEVGDKARFVRGVERALLAGEADVGVHSAKDLPAEMPEGLAIAAVPAREDPADVWIGAPLSGTAGRRGPTASGALDGVPEGAKVGTASLRRRAQLLAARPDLEVSELHGNVDTRLRKLAEGELDAIVLAAAGLRRLGREQEVSFPLPAATMTPAAGQGALVLQTRTSGNEGEEAPGAVEAARAAASIGEEIALRELTAERAVVALLDATCATPIGVYARIVGEGKDPVEPPPPSDVPIDWDDGKLGVGSLVVEAFVGLPDGSEWIRDRVEGDSGEPAAAGALLAERLLGAGAREILDRAETWTGEHA